MNILQLATTDEDFAARVEALTHWQQPETKDVEGTVRGIVEDVRTRGDTALVEYTNRFDRRSLSDADGFCLRADALAVAWDRVGEDARAALDSAAGRIRAFHQHQVER